MSKWLRWIVFAALLAIPSVSWAQCTGGLIDGCPAAVNPQPGDLGLVWQLNQSPHTRAATFQEIVNGGLLSRLTSKIQALPSSSSSAGLNLGIGITPGSCIPGDIWETSAGLYSCPTGTPVGPIAPVTSVNVPVYANATLLPSVAPGNNGQQAFVQNCPNGSQSGGSATGCLYLVNTAGTWVAQPNPSTSTITIGGQALYLGGATSNQGNGSKLQLASGTFTVGHALAYDNNGNAVDSGVPPSGGSGGSGTITASPQNAIPFYSSSGSASVVSGMNIVNNAVLATNGSGVPSEVTTLPTGLTIPSATLSSPTLSGTVNVTGSVTYTGKQTFSASTTSAASINLPPGTAPSSAVNGDLWTTSGGLFARINGVTQQFLASLSATAPIIATTTGSSVALTCPTCATTTNGGALGATSPLSISAAGLITLGNQPMPIVWIVDGATTVHNDTYNFIEKWPFNNPGTITNFVYHTGGTSTPSFTVTLEINGTPITGCSAISVSSLTDSTATCTAANTIASGQTLTMVTSGTTGSPSSAVIQVNASRPAS